MWCLDVFFFSKQKCYVNLTVRLWLVWNSFRFSTWKQAVRNMVCSTLARLHMNGRLWVNDPDCLIIRKDVFWAAFTYLETKWPLVLLEKRPHKLESHWGFYIGIHLYNKIFFTPKTLGPIHYFRSQFHTTKTRANKTDLWQVQAPLIPRCLCPKLKPWPPWWPSAAAPWSSPTTWTPWRRRGKFPPPRRWGPDAPRMKYVWNLHFFIKFSQM